MLIMIQFLDYGPVSSGGKGTKFLTQHRRVRNVKPLSLNSGKGNLSEITPPPSVEFIPFYRVE